MPTIELMNTELKIYLNWWEKALSLHGNLSVPLKHIRGATEDEQFRGLKLGIRAPGIGIPGVIQAGTYHKNGEAQFVFWTRGKRRVVIELANEKLARIILGVQDARKVAIEIQAAINK